MVVVFLSFDSEGMAQEPGRQASFSEGEKSRESSQRSLKESERGDACRFEERQEL